MKELVFDASRATDFYSSNELEQIGESSTWALNKLLSGEGPGNEFTGWINWPIQTERQEVARILKCAKRIRSQSEILVVVGIGGSYLGTKAALNLLQPAFEWMKKSKDRKVPLILFAGTQLSGTYHKQLLEALKGKDFSVNIISKSGTTTEPAIAFRTLRRMLEKQFGKKGAQKRIIATTDASKGALRKLADEKGYETFVVPDDIGGRFSVLTAVGLLPLAVAGLDVKAILKGAAEMRERSLLPFAENPVLQYAGLRNVFHRKGKAIEMLSYYEPGFQFVAEWWKQLFGESEGKDGKGIFPASAGFTTDLHSMGQYVQDGVRHLFETVLVVEKAPKDLVIKKVEGNPDGLNYLAGKTMNYVNEMAVEGTLQAHTEGGVPNLFIRLPEISERHLGSLFYFFEMACGVSGLMLGVNPFDQPGVEAYKKNMFRLLGKPK